MDRAQIRAEWDKFIEYPSDDKRFVSTLSAQLFAEHIAKLQATQAEPVQAGELPDAVLKAAQKKALFADSITHAVELGAKTAWQAALSARNPLTDMDRAVLRMPMDMAFGDELGRFQFYQRVQGLLDRIDGIGLEVKP